MLFHCHAGEGEGQGRRGEGQGRGRRGAGEVSGRGTGSNMWRVSLVLLENFPIGQETNGELANTNCRQLLFGSCQCSVYRTWSQTSNSLLHVRDNSLIKENVVLWADA